jgi:hypothetical protein
MLNRLWLLLLIFAGFTRSHADVALLLEEPYGIFGSVNPTGHAAVYLPQVCAASPTQLRRCEPGEGGAVISRYYKIGGYDWVAMPLLPYLYAVDTLEEIPQSADKRLLVALREKYRRSHLLDLVPDGPNERAQNDAWVQLVGAAYIRKIYGFRIKTSQRQDDAFIQYFNERSNKSKFSLFFANCADLAREVLNFYEPHAIHRNFLADAGITTPKQVARSLAAYARRHPELELYSFQIQQVPGSIKRSKSPNSVAEALLKSKKYVVPLVILSPYTACGIGVAYLTGRFNPKKNAEIFDVASAFQPQRNGSDGLRAAANSSPPQSSSANRITASATSADAAEETR